jgi:hypothetical protein
MNGLVERTGAWYKLADGEKIQGRDAFIEYVKTNEEYQNELRSSLNG